MAFDETLANRVRDIFGHDPAIGERKMFGGLAFMHGPHMCCGLIGDELMVRVGPVAYAAALAEPHVRPMDFTGRPLTGMVMVAAEGVASEAALRRWVERGVAFVGALPAKKKAASKPKARAKKVSGRALR